MSGRVSGGRRRRTARAGTVQDRCGRLLHRGDRRGKCAQLRGQAGLVGQRGEGALQSSDRCGQAVHLRSELRLSSAGQITSRGLKVLQGGLHTVDATAASMLPMAATAALNSAAPNTARPTEMPPPSSSSARVWERLSAADRKLRQNSQRCWSTRRCSPPPAGRPAPRADDKETRRCRRAGA